MTSASREHNLITVNTARELSVQLKNRPCEAYMNDMTSKLPKRVATITQTSLLSAARRNLRTRNRYLT